MNEKLNLNNPKQSLSKRKTRNQKRKADVLDVDQHVSVFNEGLQVKSVELGNQDVPLPTLTRLSQKKFIARFGYD